MVLENTVEHNDDRSKLDRDVTDNELKNNGHTAVSRHVRSDGDISEIKPFLVRSHWSPQLIWCGNRHCINSKSWLKLIWTYLNLQHINMKGGK